MTAPRITVTPSKPLTTDEIAITLAGLSPGAHVRIESELVDDSNVAWFAEGWYFTDHAGEIDLRTAPCEKGTYTGVNHNGLIWSMRPRSGTDRSFMTEADNKNHMRGVPDFDPLAPHPITLRLFESEKLLATCDFAIRRLSDEVEHYHVSHGRLRGIAFRQKDRAKARGAIMSLTGSGGGVEMGHAPALASAGYDVLSLAYFAYPGVPEMLMDIDLEYFEEGFAWMRQEFSAEKCAVQGASRGGELTLMLAAYLPHDVKGACAIVPMHIANSGWNHETGEIGASWTYKGERLPYAPSMDDLSFEEQRKIAAERPLGFPYAPEFRKVLDDDDLRREKAIPVERADGPILLISGLDDMMWDCAWGSDHVVNRLRAHGFPHHYEHCALRETGHWTPLPNTVTTFTPAVYHTLAEIFLACGGTPEGTALHSRRMWDAKLAHYERVFAR